MRWEGGRHPPITITTDTSWPEITTNLAVFDDNEAWDPPRFFIPAMLRFMAALVPIFGAALSTALDRPPRLRRLWDASIPANPKLHVTTRCATPFDMPMEPMVEASTAIFDVTRARVRLEGYSTYTIISALIMNAALRLLTSTDTDFKKMGLPTWLHRIAQILFVTSISAAVMCGAHCTVIFALVGVYAKMAVGLEMDSAASLFLQNTSQFRRDGFHSFVVCLVGFSISYPTSLFFKIRGKTRWVVFVVGLGLTGLMFSQWMRIIHIATELVYKPRLLLKI